MKPFGKQNRARNWWRSLSIVASCLFTAMVVTACGNKGGNAPPPPPPIFIPPGGVVPVCQSCASGSQFLVPAMGQVYGSVDMSVTFDFFATTNFNPQMPGMGGGVVSNPHVNYAGPVMSQAVIYLGTPIPLCNIPGGVYNVRTVQPGLWGNDGAGRSVENLYFDGGGPVPVQLYVSGYISPSVPPAQGRDGRTFPFRLKAFGQIKRTDNTMVCDFYLE